MCPRRVCPKATLTHEARRLRDSASQKIPTNSAEDPNFPAEMVDVVWWHQMGCQWHPTPSTTLACALQPSVVQRGEVVGGRLGAANLLDGTVLS